MYIKNTLSCYCFNKSCPLSIFHAVTCLKVDVPFEVALSRPLNCVECGLELTSAVLIELKQDVLRLLEKENNYTVSIVDDDVIFHETVKGLLKKRNLLRADFYDNCSSFFDSLEEKLYKKDELSNILFLDINMPDMDGWEFLKRFESYNEKLDNHISVYIISNSVNPNDHERAKDHASVKSFISKPLTRHFLEKINDELLKIVGI